MDHEHPWADTNELAPANGLGPVMPIQPADLELATGQHAEGFRVEHHEI